MASHTISVEVRTNSLSETTTLDPLVREGDKLPLKGVKKYKSTEMIKAGDARPDACLKFKLWEGNITSNISDNKFIGMIKLQERIWIMDPSDLVKILSLNIR